VPANFAHSAAFRHYHDRSVSLRRISPLLGLLLIVPAAVVGCPPGTLEDPDRFIDASTTCPPGYDVPKDLFAKRCVQNCHSKKDKKGKLDLESPDVASRLIGVPSGNADCAVHLLIDPADPDQSYLLEKLEDSSPACGKQMPNTPKKATAAERDCVRQWVSGLVGADSGAGGAAGASASDSGGDE